MNKILYDLLTPVLSVHECVCQRMRMHNAEEQVETLDRSSLNNYDGPHRSHAHTQILTMPIDGWMDGPSWTDG